MSVDRKAELLVGLGIIGLFVTTTAAACSPYESAPRVKPTPTPTPSLDTPTRFGELLRLNTYGKDGKLKYVLTQYSPNVIEVWNGDYRDNLNGIAQINSRCKVLGIDKYPDQATMLVVTDERDCLSNFEMASLSSPDATPPPTSKH